MEKTDKVGTVHVAALADLHAAEGSAGVYRDLIQDICDHADILVLCGDLTNRGLPTEAHLLADELFSPCRIPIVGVLGNHDFECGHQDEVNRILCDAGLIILEDEPREILGIGFAGVKGFCGGFDRHALAPWGEDTIKQFVHETVEDALRLESGLAKLRTEHKLVVLHYAPVRDTVQGEPPEIFPFLGSSRLAEPIDRFRATAVFHGHAHNGTHRGQTIGGIPVYNVALPLMRQLNAEHPYFLLELDQIS